MKTKKSYMIVKNIRKITALLLLLIIPISIFGIDIHKHLCKINSEESVSLYVNAECHHKPEKETKHCKSNNDDELPPCCKQEHQSEKANNNKSSDEPECHESEDCCYNRVSSLTIEDPFNIEKNNLNRIDLFPAYSIIISEKLNERANQTDFIIQINRFIRVPTYSIIEFIHKSSVSSGDEYNIS